MRRASLCRTIRAFPERDAWRSERVAGLSMSVWGASVCWRGWAGLGWMEREGRAVSIALYRFPVYVYSFYEV